MFSWLLQTPALVLGLSLLLVPGFGIAWLLRLRGAALVAVATAASLAIIALASLLAPVVGLEWGTLPIVAAAAIATALIALLRFLPIFRSELAAQNAGRNSLWLLLIPTGILALSVIITVGEPNAISQTYDAVFHYNNTRHILDGASPSSLEASLVWGGQQVFYPSLWHAIAAVIAQTTTPVAANNLLALMTVSVIWPLGGAYLLRTVLGGERNTLLFGAVLLAAFPAFPLFFLDWGVLYPNLLSYSLLPIAFASVLQLLGYASQKPPAAVSWVVLGGVLLPMGLAHPSGIYALLVLSLALGIVKLIKALRAAEWSQRITLLALSLLGAGAALWLWAIGLNDSLWEVIISPSQAMGDVLFNAPPRRLPAMTASVLSLTGGILAWRNKGLRWLLAPVATVAVLYVIVASFPADSIRTLFGGIWYNDSRRIIAFLPVAMLPLAALGATKAFDWLSKKFVGLSKPLLVFTVLLVVSSQLIGMNYARYSVVREYALNEASDLVTPDELEIFDYIDEHLPEDAVLVANPWTGGALAYAVTGRSVTFPHMSGRLTEEERYLAANFAVGNERVCEIVDDLGITHAVEFGGMMILGDIEKDGLSAQREVFAGLNNLHDSQILLQMYSVGEAKLYSVSGCR